MRNSTNRYEFNDINPENIESEELKNRYNQINALSEQLRKTKENIKLSTDDYNLTVPNNQNPKIYFITSLYIFYICVFSVVWILGYFAIGLF